MILIWSLHGKNRESEPHTSSTNVVRPEIAQLSYRIIIQPIACLMFSGLFFYKYCDTNLEKCNTILLAVKLVGVTKLWLSYVFLETFSFPFGLDQELLECITVL